MFSVNLPPKSTCSIRENSSENWEVFIYYLIIFSENMHRENITNSWTNAYFFKRNSLNFMANTHKRKLFVVSLGWSKAGLQVAPKTYFESSRVKWCRDVQKGSKNYFELVGGSSSRESLVSRFKVKIIFKVDRLQSIVVAKNIDIHVS